MIIYSTPVRYAATSPIAIRIPSHRNVRPYKLHQTHACGHALSFEPCDEYADLLQVCLANPGELRKFTCSQTRRAPRSLEACKFCKKGKDIEGEWTYGENWLGADRFLQQM